MAMTMPPPIIIGSRIAPRAGSACLQNGGPSISSAPGRGRPRPPPGSKRQTAQHARFPKTMRAKSGRRQAVSDKQPSMPDSPKPCERNQQDHMGNHDDLDRSEERRVGKEGKTP